MREKVELDIDQGWVIAHHELYWNEPTHRMFEDLFQTPKKLPDGGALIVDAGWYQSTSKVFLARNEDWSNPIESVDCKNINYVVFAISQFV